MPGSLRSSWLEEQLRDIWGEAARQGGTMPSEPALAATLSSSRPAVREALIRLEERGYIHRRKGADTAVNTSLLDIPARFDRRIDKADLIAAMGRTPSVDVLATEIAPITLDEAQEYQIAPGTPVLRVTKMWSADGMPVLLARDSVPVSRRVDTAKVDAAKVDAAAVDPAAVDPAAVDPAEPMVELAITLTGERVEWEIVWPRADALDDADAAAVGRPAGEPVLALDVTGVTRTGEICYWTSEFHLRGAFRYAMVRRADWR